MKIRRKFIDNGWKRNPTKQSNKWIALINTHSNGVIIFCLPMEELAR
jgi:hypothetical protein